MRTHFFDAPDVSEVRLDFQGKCVIHMARNGSANQQLHAPWENSRICQRKIFSVFIPIEEIFEIYNFA